MRAVLMLSESAGTDWFGRLAAGARHRLLDGRAHRRPEHAAGAERCPASRADRGTSGRDPRGSRGSTLGARATVADRLPIREVLAAGELAGALRVVPWGVGKWLFGRGRLVNELIGEARPGNGFFLGDSGGTPGAGRICVTSTARPARGIQVLPGTDPLPVSRPGGASRRLRVPAGLAGGHPPLRRGDQDSARDTRTPSSPPTAAWRGSVPSSGTRSACSSGSVARQADGTVRSRSLLTFVGT